MDLCCTRGAMTYFEYNGFAELTDRLNARWFCRVTKDYVSVAERFRIEQKSEETFAARVKKS